MKRYSKEWWQQKAVYSSELICALIREGKINKATRVGRIRNYCFKRYAEAYYKEKSWEDFTEEFDEVGKAQKIVGRLEERERILGIIEERAAHYRHKKRSAPNLGRRRDRFKYREFALNDIIEKIKSE